MVAGKTAAGREAAGRIGVDFVDVDAVVAERVGCSVAELWGQRGEAAFRELEAAVVHEVAAGPPAVIAPGGGVVLDPRNVEAMRASGVVVWLEAPPEELAARADGGRPLLEGVEAEARLAELLEIRAPLYEAAAHHRVDTTGRSVNDVAAEVVPLWPGPTRITVGDASEVLIGRDLLGGGVLPERSGRERVVVLTQPGARRVAARVAEGLGAEVLELPDGEAAKTLAVVEATYRRLAADRLHRDDTIVAVGGGSLTDVVGFVAATYLRGVESVYVPTTLLGAVDAAVGGKTGVNLDGKNLVGAFHHPARVVIDVGVLEDLPDALWQEGAAEALKAGLIADRDLVDLFERHGRDAPLAEVVRRAVAVKAAVVAEDFREGGRRAILNYGHTVGHAVEVAAGMPHGHAVAVGMVAAGAASEAACGFAHRERQDGIITALGLLTSARADRAEVRRLLTLDKKRDAAGLRMVLLEDIASPVLRHVDAATVEAALDAVLT